MELVDPVNSSEEHFRYEISVLPEIEGVDITLIWGNEREIAVQSELKQSLPCQNNNDITLA